MDALDIFRKLTKGLSFKQRVIGVNSNKKCTDTDNFKTISDEKQAVINNEGNELEVIENEENVITNDDEVSEFSLMKGIKMTETGIAKSKKRKKKPKKITEQKRTAIELEEARRYRSDFGIRVNGLDPTPPIKDFFSLIDKYEVPQILVENLVQCGYMEPTPIQKQAIPSMLEGRQILACAPTGSGKTAAFLIPLLHELKSTERGPRALVLCPTRELSKQIYREALRLSAGTNLVVNFVPKINLEKIESKKLLLRKTDLLISTPNRLCFLLDHESSPINLGRVKWLVIDEADRLFEGSETNEADFRPQLEKIMRECWMEASLSLFSATQTPTILEWCKRNLDQLLNITVGQRNAATDLVEQELQYVGNEYGKLVAFRQLVQKGLKPPVLVFVQSKDRAKQLFKELIYDGINVDVIHANRTQLQRDNVVKSFRMGKIWVLICTELMGRGIDFRGVNLVINYDFPPSAISYVHRIGRAGRAGLKGKAVTFFTQDDTSNLKSVVNVMKQSGCQIPEYMLSLKQTKKDRRKLLKHAPKREDISTELPDKKTLKRKLKEDIMSNPKKSKMNNDNDEKKKTFHKREGAKPLVKSKKIHKKKIAKAQNIKNKNHVKSKNKNKTHN